MKIGWSLLKDHPIHVCLVAKHCFSLVVDICRELLRRQMGLAVVPSP